MLSVRRPDGCTLRTDKVAPVAECCQHDCNQFADDLLSVIHLLPRSLMIEDFKDIETRAHVACAVHIYREKSVEPGYGKTWVIATMPLPKEPACPL
ncbi:hypothetical protein EMIT0347P_50497 [Pseudomonas sp. IT-347P]